MSPAPHTQHVHADAIAIASSKGHHGLAFWPPPSDHPDDPLRWPRWMKIVALVAVSLSNFTANFAGSGFSVAEQILMQQFQKNHSQVNSLLTFNFLLLGIGNLFWVPMSTKFGKRPIMLISMAMLFAILIWTAKAQTFNSLLAARCLSGFASSAGESIVPGIVSDMFFIHERATMLSIYVVLTAGASAVGPLVGAFVVSYSPGTWRDFSWVCAALAGFNLLLMFFLYPESSFKRPNSAHGAHSTQDRTIEKLDKEDDRPSFEYNEQSDVEVGGVQSFANAEVKWTKIWTSFIKYDTSIGLPVAFLRAIILVACPNVLWTIFVYGSSLAAQIILIFAFPSLLMAPPYLFGAQGVGLIEIAAIIGIVIACFGGGILCDLITSYKIHKEGNRFYPEQRLWSIIPGFWIAPVGCIVVAICCSEKLSWIGIAFGFGMLSFGTVYLPNVAITYVTDCYPQFASDCLVTINACKNLVAFIFLYVAVDWVNDQGWIQVYMIMFMLTILAPLLAIPMYFYGESLRHKTSGIAYYGFKKHE